MLAKCKRGAQRGASAEPSRKPEVLPGHYRRVTDASSGLCLVFPIGLCRSGVSFGLHEPRDIDTKLVLEHREHRRHPAPHGAHHFGDAVGPSRAVAHLDDVDLVDAGQLRREGLRELGHFFHDHVDDRRFVEVLPRLGLLLQPFCLGEQLLFDDLGLRLPTRCPSR